MYLLTPWIVFAPGSCISARFVALPVSECQSQVVISPCGMHAFPSLHVGCVCSPSDHSRFLCVLSPDHLCRNCISTAFLFICRLGASSLKGLSSRFQSFPHLENTATSITQILDLCLLLVLCSSDEHRNGPSHLSVAVVQLQSAAVLGSSYSYSESRNFQTSFLLFLQMAGALDKLSSPKDPSTNGTKSSPVVPDCRYHYLVLTS